jgi:hypothetical protein
LQPCNLRGLIASESFKEKENQLIEDYKAASKFATFEAELCIL